MGKEYRYRRHLFWCQNYIIPIVFGMTILFMWVAVGVLSLASSAPSIDFVLDGISFTGVFLLQGLVLWYISYRLTGVRVSISEGAIKYKNRTGEIRIRPSEITKIQFPSIRYAGGWIKIISAENTIRLTVVVEEIGEFLKEIKTLLDNTGQSHRYDRQKFFNFLKTATYCDQSWARIYSFFWCLILATLIFGIMGVIIAMVGDFGLMGITVCFLFSYLWPFLTWAVVEIIFGRKIARESDKEGFVCPPRDAVYERALAYKVSLASLFFYLAGSLSIIAPRLFM